MAKFRRSPAEGMAITQSVPALRTPLIGCERKLKSSAGWAGVVVGRHAYDLPRLDPLDHLRQKTKTRALQIN
jgi:hypothetical protein